MARELKADAHLLEITSAPFLKRLAQNFDRTLIPPQKTQQDFLRRRLAGTARAQKAEYFPLFDCKAEIGNRRRIAVIGKADIVDPDHPAPPFE